MPTPAEIKAQNNALLAQHQQQLDRFGSYEARRDANVANNFTLLDSMKAQRSTPARTNQPFIVPMLDETAFLKPHATVGEYTEEPNAGPKTGFRPTYFFDLDQATDLVTVTVSGEVLVPAPDTFAYSAVDIDPTLPMADFLAAVVAGLGTNPEIVFFVARDGTSLGIVGQTGYELGTVTVTVV